MLIALELGVMNRIGVMLVALVGTRRYVNRIGVN